MMNESIKLEQPELFETENDGRVDRLRDYIHRQFICHQDYNPTARELVEIGDLFGIVGALPLRVFLEEQEKILKIGSKEL